MNNVDVENLLVEVGLVKKNNDWWLDDWFYGNESIACLKYAIESIETFLDEIILLHGQLNDKELIDFNWLTRAKKLMNIIVND